MRPRPRKQPRDPRRLIPPAMPRLVAYARAMKLLARLRANPRLRPMAARLQTLLTSAHFRLQRCSRIERSRQPMRGRLQQRLVSPRPVAEDAADFVGDAVDTVTDAVNDAADAVGEFIDEAADAVSDVIGRDAMEAVSDVIGHDAMEKLKRALRSFIEHMEREWQDFQNFTP